MDRLIRIFGAHLVLLVSAATYGETAFAQAACGAELALHRDEPARSNGAQQGTSNECGSYYANDAQGFGYEWQCVEYVRRLFSRQLGITLPRANAADYEQRLVQFGFRPYWNDESTELPQPDDIIVFGRRLGGTDPFGHIAIVTGNFGSAIQIIEQNWSVTGTASLPYTADNGPVSISPRQGRSGYYPVRAWFRRPAAPPPPAGTVVFQPGPEGFDTVYGTAFAPGPNGDLERLYDGGWGDYYFDFFRWDLSSLPAADRVRQVVLQLYFSARPNDPAFQVRRVTSPWDEATLTRSNYPTATAWGSWTGIVAEDWYSLDITELYTNWKNGTWPNFGIELAPTANLQTNGLINSSDYQADPTLRPKLVITTR